MTRFEEDFQLDLEELIHGVLDDDISDSTFDGKKTKFIEKYAPQALPVVPECVAVAIEKDKQANLSISDVFEATFSYENHHLTEAGLWTKNNPEEYIVARNIGYTVEKPQLFKLIFPNSTSVLQKNGELNSFADTVYKRYLTENAMTEQEIKSIDERYWQFAVPVEDGE